MGFPNIPKSPVWTDIRGKMPALCLYFSDFARFCESESGYSGESVNLLILGIMVNLMMILANLLIPVNLAILLNLVNVLILVILVNLVDLAILANLVILVNLALLEVLALLPRWSPFGDFGPHLGTFVCFLVPINQISVIVIIVTSSAGLPC